MGRLGLDICVRLVAFGFERSSVACAGFILMYKGFVAN